MAQRSGQPLDPLYRIQGLLEEAYQTVARSGNPHLTSRHLEALRLAAGPYITELSDSSIEPTGDDVVRLETGLQALTLAASADDTASLLHQVETLLSTLPGDPVSGPRPPKPRPMEKPEEETA